MPLLAVMLLALVVLLPLVGSVDDLVDDFRPAVHELHLQLLGVLLEVHDDHLHTRAIAHAATTVRLTCRCNATAVTATLVAADTAYYVGDAAWLALLLLFPLLLLLLLLPLLPLLPLLLRCDQKPHCCALPSLKPL